MQVGKRKVLIGIPALSQVLIGKEDVLIGFLPLIPSIITLRSFKSTQLQPQLEPPHHLPRSTLPHKHYGETPPVAALISGPEVRAASNPAHQLRLCTTPEILHSSILHGPSSTLH